MTVLANESYCHPIVISETGDKRNTVSITCRVLVRYQVAETLLHVYDDTNIIQHMSYNKNRVRVLATSRKCVNKKNYDEKYCQSVELIMSTLFVTKALVREENPLAQLDHY